MVNFRNRSRENIDPPPEAPDTLHEATIFAMQGLKELRTTVATQSAEILRLQAELATAHAEATTYKQLSDDNQRERDHYIRFSTELVTQMQTARHLFDDCFERAKLSLFEKKAIPAPTQKELDEVTAEPIPAFLTREVAR